MCCIQILTAYDPQKALANLPKPLLTSDLFSIPLGAKVQRVELTAGLHRQTRINGSVIHVDIHVASRSSKTVKKIEIQLVKAALWYPHLAAGTGGSVANHLRLPRRTVKELVRSSTIKKWKTGRASIQTVTTSVPVIS
jgi:hypothetical protein